MGAIAEALAAYAQPLLDETDGSVEQLNKAFSISQLCFNLALMPHDSREQTLGDMRQSLGMDDEEFDDFRRCVVLPMIRRHQEMFPQMHSRASTGFSPSRPAPSRPAASRPAASRPAASRFSPSGPSRKSSAEAYPGTGRYAPCPCNSGRKYKFCCGKK